MMSTLHFRPTPLSQRRQRVPDAPVHYTKGYFLLRFLARALGEETYFSFLRKFVHLFHGQLILSQDFLQMLLESIPEDKRLGLTVENIIRDWLECSGIPKVMGRENLYLPCGNT
ncbi:hypothetical protein U0070_018587 [Myodes glareolus]|uniref:Peptidase M1 membrane alanine aminopeptidase domain-containing protein n=1 Tax=Myodes glareolus TaxID=447135 RepID=A0AAW0ICA5_MYOGA